MAYPRITVEPNKMGGQPCIRSLRFPVATIVAMAADGMTHEEILSEHPDLEQLDVVAALAYAADTLRDGKEPIGRT